MWGGYKYTYEKYFYHRLEKGKHIGNIKGFPMQRKPWCQQLKVGYGARITESNLRRLVLQSVSERQEGGQIQGFPISINRGQYCQQLKRNIPNNADIRISDDKRSMVQFGIENATTKFSRKTESEVVQYLGIASDEPKRIKKHKNKKGIVLPLVDIGWTEADAKAWCIDNDLLSPIYTDKCMRGGVGSATIKA